MDKKELYKTFCEKKKNFITIKDEMWGELRDMRQNIESVGDETEENLVLLNKILDDVNEMTRKCSTQITLYNTFIDMKDNMKKMADCLNKF